jgi:ribosomal protein L32
MIPGYQDGNGAARRRRTAKPKALIMIPFICPTCGQFDLDNSACTSCSTASAVVEAPGAA